MRLLFDPEPPLVRWRQDTAKGLRGGQAALGAQLLKAVKKIAVPPSRASSISYRLHHGGGRICKPVLRLTPETLDAVRDCVGLLPEHNELTYRAMQQMLRLAPDVPHFALCDTAFFSDMPAAASAYAVPVWLRSRGARRYGGCGLAHQWAWQKALALGGRGLARMISVQLGDHTNASAIKEGRPVDTTMGFTPVEGIPSSASCGDIDASVVFELRSAGMSLSEINELLSARSGLRALADKPCGFRDLIREDGDAGQALARKILIYDIVRYIGAFAALLGGVDAVCFVVEDPLECAPFTTAICRELGFLGGAKTMIFTGNSWRIMSQLAAAAEKEN